MAVFCSVVYFFFLKHAFTVLGFAVVQKRVLDENR